MLFNASPLQAVSPTFKKIQKIGIPKAKFFVGSGNRRSSKGSVSLCPSCSASSHLKTSSSQECAGTVCPGAGLWVSCSLSPLESSLFSGLGHLPVPSLLLDEFLTSQISTSSLTYIADPSFQDEHRHLFSCVMSSEKDPEVELL